MFRSKPFLSSLRSPQKRKLGVVQKRNTPRVLTSTLSWFSSSSSSSSSVDRPCGNGQARVEEEPPFDSFQTYAHVHWYPGHMEKAMHKMKEQIDREQVGVLMEVRDARVPLSSMNNKLDSLTAVKMDFRDAWGQPSGTRLRRIRKMVLYNKCDLVDGGYASADNPEVPNVRRPKWRSTLEENHRRCFPADSLYFTQLGDWQSGVGIQKQVESLLMEAVRHWVDLHRPALAATPSRPYPPLKILVTGLPNTGKSTLINALRVYGLGYQSWGKRKGAKVASVGALPGHTRHVSGSIKIVDTETINASHTSPVVDPRLRLASETSIAQYLRARNVRLKVFVVDSPGILPPSLRDRHTAVKLALVGCFPNDGGGKRGADSMLLCEYLWWRLRERWHIAQAVLANYHFPLRSDSEGTKLPAVQEFLSHLARERKQKSEELSKTDVLNAAEFFLSQWRKGVLYEQLGVFRPSSGKLQQDLWHITMVDDALKDPHLVRKSFDERFERNSYNGEDGRATVVTHTSMLEEEEQERKRLLAQEKRLHAIAGPRKSKQQKRLY